MVEVGGKLNELYQHYSSKSAQVFWYRHLKNAGSDAPCMFAELFETKELWDRRTYNIISLSSSSAKWDFIRKNRVKSEWVKGGVTQSSGQRSILQRAMKFKYMDSVPVLWRGRFYGVSPGDAEAVLLKYQGMEETDKTELSEEPFEYLKL